MLMEEMRTTPQMTQEEQDALKLQQKLSVLHKGPCSSPRKEKGDDGCTCPRDCPLHGRCCDCIAHHKNERLEGAAQGWAAFDPKWMPHCIAWFDERHGILCEADPDAGNHPLTQAEIAELQSMMGNDDEKDPPTKNDAGPKLPNKYEMEQLIVKGEKFMREREMAASH